MERPQKPALRYRVREWIRRKKKLLPWFRPPKPIEKKPLPPNGLRILFYCNAGVTSAEVAGNLYLYWQRHPPGFPVTVDAAGHITGNPRAGDFMYHVRRADIVVPIIGHDEFGIKMGVQERGWRRNRRRKDAREIRRKRLEWYSGSAPKLSLNLGQHQPAELAQRIEAWVGARYILSGETFPQRGVDVDRLRQVWERSE